MNYDSQGLQGYPLQQPGFLQTVPAPPSPVQAKDFAIARISRSPGFRELVELLDELAQRYRDDAFHSNESDLRTLDRAKGATQLVEQFKTQIARVAQETQLG